MRSWQKGSRGKVSPLLELEGKHLLDNGRGASALFLPLSSEGCMESLHKTAIGAHIRLSPLRS